MPTTTSPRPALPITPTRPAVPLTLWLTAPAGTTTESARDGATPDTITDVDLDDPDLSPELAQRIVEEYSRPGELIVDLSCATGTVLLAAAERQRRAVAVSSQDRIAAAAFGHCERQLRPEQMRDVEVITASVHGLPLLRPNLAGAAHLAILTRPDCANSDVQVPRESSAGGQDGDGLSAMLRAARGLLRPGGLLVTVTRGAYRRAGFRDTAGAMVRLARESGFGYTQHVIAVHSPLDGDQLAAAPTPGELAQLRADRRAGRRRHLLIHQDVCVFVNVPTADSDHPSGEDVTA